MTEMITIGIQEHNENKAFILKMLSQISQLSIDKEVIFATSSGFQEFYSKYGTLDNYGFPISVIGKMDSCGAGRNAIGRMASGDPILFLDAHICFTPDAVSRVLATQKAHPDAVIAPSLQPVAFPECTPEGGKGHGVAFSFSQQTPFEWTWLPSETEAHEYTSPFVCGCAFMMKKETFNVLNTHGGFLGSHQGLGFEEEKSMRLWRLNRPTFVEPRATFGHMFKGHQGKPQWDQHSTAGFYRSRVVGFYINVFDKDLWNQIESILISTWGDEYVKNLEYAKTNYTWLRNLMKPFKDKIDERWFLRVK